jgi:hypothetical protein
MSFDTSIVGGTLVSEQGRVRLNIGVREGVIRYLGRQLERLNALWGGRNQRGTRRPPRRKSAINQALRLEGMKRR